MSHRFHPDPARNDPPLGILHDDCEECSEKADRLTGLDADRSAEMLRRVYRWREHGFDAPPSATEARFIRGLHGALITLEAAGIPEAVIRDRL